MNQTLDLAPIGNCAVSALIDRRGNYVWCCAPRVDSDPLFSNLLSNTDPSEPDAQGFWSIEVEHETEITQAYLRNTAILRTEITDSRGAKAEIIDFSPRFRMYNRTYRPTAFVRLIRPVIGAPRITIRLRPTTDWGAAPATVTSGSHHIRYLRQDGVMRLTTNAPVSTFLDERTFRLEEAIALVPRP